jgi:hypothetical protein
VHPDLIELARAKGTPKQYEQWLSHQTSCISHQWSEWDEQRGEGRSIACHIRRVSKGAGTAKKPDYWAVPMTFTEHNLQHGDGETALLTKDQFDTMPERYLRRWIAS